MKNFNEIEKKLGSFKEKKILLSRITRAITGVKRDDQTLRDNMLDGKAKCLEKGWLKVLLKETATSVILFQSTNQNS